MIMYLLELTAMETDMIRKTGGAPSLTTVVAPILAQLIALTLATILLVVVLLEEAAFGGVSDILNVSHIGQNSGLRPCAGCQRAAHQTCHPTWIAPQWADVDERHGCARHPSSGRRQRLPN